MAKSLVDRLSAEDYALIKERVYYDPSSPTGLRWRQVFRLIPGKPAPKDGVAGCSRTLFIESRTYPCAAVVLLLNNIWPNDGQTTTTRKDPSGSWGDVANLEWVTRSEAHVRTQNASRSALVRSVLGDSLPDLDDRHRLAKPCKKGHHWNGHPLGLYVKHGDGWRCKQCQIEKHQNPIEKQKKKQTRDAWYLSNLESQRAKARERMAKLRQNPEYKAIVNERSKQCMIRRRQAVGRVSKTGLLFPPNLLGHSLQSCDLQAFADAGWDLAAMLPATVFESRKLWFYLKNNQSAPTVAELVERQALDIVGAEKAEFIESGGTEEEWVKEYKRRRHHIRMETDPDYVVYMRQKSKRRKAQMRDSVAIQVKGREIRARFAEFNHRCAYCGADGDLHIEHVVPISKGGPHSIGNIIPACKDCNFSKRDSEVEAWYRSQPFFSELRWRKICRVLGWQRSSVGQLALL
jgi:5-methylcytosine-specific restriction endonuclease McrA